MDTPPTNDIVQKLWSLCSILREDGVTYHQYVTELTYLLFLKTLKETGREDILPRKYRWNVLTAQEGKSQYDAYRELLAFLRTHKNKWIQDIYASANTTLREPKTLSSLVKAIDELQWYSADREHIGDLYEGLLEKNATEVKSGAGQYFTPRPLVDCLVARVKPKASEVVQDPAAGTGGFLVAAARYIKSEQSKRRSSSRESLKRKSFYGVELVPETRRLALMNLLLHDIEGELYLGDALSPLGATLPPADVILTNPPFGTRKGGSTPTRDDLLFSTSNKQLAFVEHAYRCLKPEGRAAVIVPDNVLFEDNVGTSIRSDLMDKCDLHTVLRLPTGIFYAQGVKTNVLFFSRGKSDKENTKNVWFYDLRTQMPSFGKRTPLTRDHLRGFEEAFGEDPYGKAPRKDQGKNGRFRRFTRRDIHKRGDNLDINWLDEKSPADIHERPGPEAIVATIREQLQAALTEIDALTALLDEPENVS